MMIIIEAETQYSKHLDGTHNDSSFKTVSDEQESEAHKNDNKTNKGVQFVRELTPAWRVVRKLSNSSLSHRCHQM